MVPGRVFLPRLGNQAVVNTQGITERCLGFEVRSGLCYPLSSVMECGVFGRSCSSGRRSVFKIQLYLHLTLCPNVKSL